MPKPPPGIAEGDFQAALRELEAVVGRDWLFKSEEDVALYKDGYSPLWGEPEERVASAAVAPNSVEQIQAIVGSDCASPPLPIRLPAVRP